MQTSLNVWSVALLNAILLSAATAHANPLKNNQIEIVSSSDAAKSLGCKKFQAAFPSDIKKGVTFYSDNILLKKGKLIDNSTSYCSISTSPNPEEPAKISLIEAGTLDAVKVEINHSAANAIIGSGKVFDNQGWEAGCKRDDFSDQKHCFIRQYGITFTLQRGLYSLYVGNDLAPGYPVELKLDKEETIKSNNPKGLINQEDTDSFLKSVNKNSKVLVRYQILGHRDPEVRTIDASTINAAMLTMRLIDSAFE